MLMLFFPHLEEVEQIYSDPSQISPELLPSYSRVTPGLGVHVVLHPHGEDVAADEDREVLRTPISDTKSTALYTCAVLFSILKLAY